MEKKQVAGTDLLSLIGFALILVGILIVVAVVLLMTTRPAGKGNVKAGGAIIIGPVPIVFGTDKKSLKTVLLLSVGLTVLLLVVAVVSYFLGWKSTAENEPEGEGVTVSSRMMMFLFVGFAVAIVGIILVILASAVGGGSASAGGVIFIGPFPIVFGAGPDVGWLIVISLVIAVLMFVLFFVLRRRSWRA